MPSYLGGNDYAAALDSGYGSQYSQPSNVGSSVATGAATGAMAGGPVGAAIGAGGAFLIQYLAQRVADERAKRDRAAQIEQQYAENQNKGFDTLMNTYRGALR